MVSAWVRRVVTLAAVVTATSAFAVQTPERRPPTPIAFDDTAQVLTQILKTAELLSTYRATGDERSAIQKQLGRIKDGAGSLQNGLKKRPVTDFFYRTLQWDALALARVNGGRPPARDAIETTTGVADDLQVKAAFVGATSAAPPPDVTVEAHTKNGAGDESGYRVVYVVAGLAGDPGQTRSFPQLSSPSTYELPPGAYVMWTRRPTGGTEGARTTLDIGKSGQTKMALDLQVPPPGRRP